MNVLGALIAFVVVLFFGIPLVLLTGTTTTTTPVLMVLSNIAAQLLSGFLIVYIFAVLSSIVFAAIGELITLTASNVRTRWVLIWILSLFYFVSTVLYLLFVAPPLFSFLYTTVSSGHSPLMPAFLLLIGMSLGHFFAVLMAYVAASVLAPPHDQYVYADGEMFVRGLLIGSNAGMNSLLGATAIGGVLTLHLGIVGVVIGCGAGIVLAVVSLLPAGMPTGSEDANASIKRIVGWMSWLMPMSWPVVSLGWILYVLSALFNVLLGWTPFYGLYLINAIVIEWPYGTLFIEGGIGSNLWLQGPMHSRGAYDLGTFAFIHADTVREQEPLTGAMTAVGLGADQIFDKATRKHECGHNLNLTALGSFFHLIGAVDENVQPLARHQNAYAERLADSNVPGPLGSGGTSDPQTPLPFWTI